MYAVIQLSLYSKSYFHKFENKIFKTVYLKKEKFYLEIFDQSQENVVFRSFRYIFLLLFLSKTTAFYFAKKKHQFKAILHYREIKTQLKLYFIELISPMTSKSHNDFFV
jgi:hypothetical protein